MDLFRVFFINMLQLVSPNISHKEQWEEVMMEWKNTESPMNPWPLFQWQDFTEFLKIIDQNRTWGSPERVPGTLLFLVNENQKILGAIEVRHRINHPDLREVGGHIGYGIRPNERRKWYAKEMLRLALIQARKLWLDIVLITCSDDNIWSYKSIESNGWIFERFAEKDWIKKRRYWIDLYREEKEALAQLELELELLSYEVRHNLVRIDELLTPNFFECGKNGDRFGKREALDSLPKEPEKKKFETQNMTVHILAENIAQVRYISTITNPWESPTISFRTSLWRKSEKWWQMFYHQGTLTQ